MQTVKHSAQYDANLSRLLAIKATIGARRAAQPVATEANRIVTHPSGRQHWTVCPDGRVHRCPECAQ